MYFSILYNLERSSNNMYNILIRDFTIIKEFRTFIIFSTKHIVLIYQKNPYDAHFDKKDVGGRPVLIFYGQSHISCPCKTHTRAWNDSYHEQGKIHCLIGSFMFNGRTIYSSLISFNFCSVGVRHFVIS